VSFTGGVLVGSWQIASNQTLNANGGGVKILSAMALDNQGAFNWNTNDTAYLQNGTVVDNHGSFNVNQSMQLYNNGGTLPVFNNYGTLKVASGQALAVGTLQFVNKGTGIVDAAGTVNFNGGNATFNSGTTFTGAGAVNINNNATFAGDYTGNNIFINGGTATGESAVIHGNTAFTGGALTGTWAVAGGQQLAMRGGGTKFASGLQLTNAGTLAVQTSDALYVQNGTNITNASTGVIDFQTDSLWYNNGGATSSIVNLGLIQKSGGVGTSTIGNGLALSNLGVVDVRTGTIQLPNNFTNDGTLKGIGAYTTNLLTNNGHVAPGESPGTLTLNGNFAQTAGGFFDVGLDGASFGQLLVNGSANLAGSIDAICLGACSYAVGTTWDVMHATTGVAGTFAGPVLMTGFSSGAFTVTYTANDVWLTVTEATVAAVPEPGTYALMLSGLAAVGCLARRRRA